MSDWKSELEPYSYLWFATERGHAREFDVLAAGILGLVSDEGLDRLEEASKTVTPTNCWYATYNAAARLVELIEWERKSRAGDDPDRAPYVREVSL